MNRWAEPKRTSSVWRVGVTLFCLAGGLAAALHAAPPPPLTLEEALEIALQKNPQIQINRQQVDSAEGAVRIEQGDFDWRFRFESRTDREYYLPGGEENIRDSREEDRLTLGVERPLQNGLILSNTYEFARDQFDGAGRQETNTGKVTFGVTFPLLQGRGRNANANLRAARRSLQSERDNFRHQVSQEVLEVIEAYWAYAATEQRLRLRRRAEDRARNFVATMERLIEADERPASDIWQVNSRLDARIAERITAEQELRQAWVDLGLKLGIPEESLVRPVPTATALPRDQVADADPSGRLDAYYRLALAERKDLQSREWRTRASRIQLAAAEDQRRPRLDLTLSAGYNAFQERSRTRRSEPSEPDPDFPDDLDPFAAALAREQQALSAAEPAPVSRDLQGLVVGFVVSADWPVPNNTARGEVQQALARLRTDRIERRDLERNIRSQVFLAVNQIMEAGQRLEVGHRRVRNEARAFEGEQRKLELGDSTVVDVLVIEENFIQAELDEIENRRIYAGALALLRFVTGSLVEETTMETWTVPDVFALPNPRVSDTALPPGIDP